MLPSLSIIDFFLQQDYEGAGFREALMAGLAGGQIEAAGGIAAMSGITGVSGQPFFSPLMSVEDGLRSMGIPSLGGLAASE